MKDKILKWIETQKNMILNPDNLAEDELEGIEYDEGEQAQVQLLNELEEYIKEEKK